MEKKEYAAFGLSIDEVYVLMKYMSAKLLLGFPYEDYEKSDEAVKNLIMQVAERALLARGFLTVDVAEKRLKLVDLIRAVFGACLFPDVTLGIDKNVPGKLPEKSYFHISRKLNVMHTVPSPMLHQFMTFQSQKAMIQAIISLLELKKTSKQGLGGEIETKDLREAGQLAGNGQLDQARVFLKGCFDEQTSELLVRALEQPVANISMLCYLTRQKQSPDVRGLALLVGQTSLWRLEPVLDEKGQPGSKTLVTPAASGELSEAIVKMLTEG